jgi:hypothetical protein
VAHFVVGYDFSLAGIEESVSLLEAGDDPFHGIAEIRHRHCFGPSPGRKQRCLVDEIGQVGPGKAGRQRGHLLRIDIGCGFHFLQVNLEDIDPAFLVGAVNQDLAVKPPCPQQRRIENLGTVGCGQYDQPGARIEAIEFDQQLVQRLLLLVVASRERSNAARTTEGIYLVDENNGRRLLVRLLKQVADPGGSDADEHLDEFGARNREKGNLGLAGDRFCQQGLAGAGRPDHQHPLGHPSAKPAVFGRILEKIDDFTQLVLCFIHPRDVLKGNAGIGFDIDFRLALADRHQSAAEALRIGDAPGDIPPKPNEQQDRHDPGEKVAEQRALDLAGVADAVFVEFARELLIQPRREELLLSARQRLFQNALDESIGDRNGIHLALAQ